MIILTRELEEEIATMKSGDELKKRFTPEEMAELNSQMLERIEEIRQETAEREQSISQGKEYFLKTYGTKPLVTIMLIDEDLVNVILFHQGEIDVYPETVSIFDGLELMDLIGDLLRISDERRRVDSQLSNYDGFINRTPLTTLDCKMYARKVAKWLLDEVRPLPKIYWPLSWHQRLKLWFYKETVPSET